MARDEGDSPSRQPDQGSLHILQLFDFSYTVLAFDEQLIQYLQTAERVNEQIQSARTLLRGLGAEVSTPKKKSMERTISDTEYHARILAQDLDPAKSEATSPRDIVTQSRIFIVLHADNQEVSKDLESLQDACSALDRLVESCKSVRANSVKRKPVQNTSAPRSQVLSPASLDTSSPAPPQATLPTPTKTPPTSTPPPTVKGDGVPTQQSSASQKAQEVLDGLPPLDASRMLHHRRTARLRNRSVNGIHGSNGVLSEQQEGPVETTTAFELPGWPTPIPIPAPSARGYTFIPTLTTMPELEAPSEIIAVTKVTSDYVTSLRSSMIEPGVHQLERHDSSGEKASGFAVPPRLEALNGIKKEDELSKSTSINIKQKDPAAPMPDASPGQQDRLKATNTAIPTSDTSFLGLDAHQTTSQRSSSISRSAQSPVSLARGDVKATPAIITSSTSGSSRGFEPHIAKAPSTRNRLRKAPYALANKSPKSFLLKSSGVVSGTTTPRLSTDSQKTEVQNITATSTGPLSSRNQSTQTSLRQAPSASSKAQQQSDDKSNPHPNSTTSNAAPDATQSTTYTPVLTTSPQFQTSRSFTIVSPPVSPQRPDFDPDQSNFDTANTDRRSITSAPSAPPVANNEPSPKFLPTSPAVKLNGNTLHEGSQPKLQDRTYSLPEMSQRTKHLSVDENWKPQRSPTHLQQSNSVQHQRHLSSPLSQPEPEHFRSQSMVQPTTERPRILIPPYPMTPVQGPVRISQQHPRMPPTAPTIPMPQIQDPPRPFVPQQPSTQYGPVSAITPTGPVPLPSPHGPFRFEPPQPMPPAGSMNLGVASQNTLSSFQQLPPQPQTFTAQTTMRSAPPVMQGYSQASFPLQSVPHPSRSATMPGTATAPLLPAKVIPSTIPEHDLQRERSFSAGKSTVSSSSSNTRQQQQQVHHRSGSGSTYVGDVGPGASMSGTTIVAPATGMARKRSSWLNRQVERAGLKSF